MIKVFSAFAVRHGLVPILYGFLRLYLLTVRVRVFGGRKLLDHLRRGRKGTAALWHQRILLVVRYAKRFSHFVPH